MRRDFMSTRTVIITSIIAINIITALMLSSCAQKSTRETAFPEEETAGVSSDKNTVYVGSLISIPSANSVSPDFSVLLPEGITFEELFEKAEKTDSAITMDTDPVPDEIKDEIHIGRTPEKETPSANLIVTISRDSLSEMIKARPEDTRKTPLTLYYRLSLIHI